MTNRPRPAVLLLLLAALLLAAAPAAAGEWREVGAFAVRDPALLAAAEGLLSPGKTGTGPVSLARALYEAAEGRPFAGRILVSRESSEVALVAKFARGGAAVEPETAILDGVHLYRDATSLAASTGRIPDPDALVLPEDRGTAGIEFSLDVTEERTGILAALRARDLTLGQRAAVEEALAPGLAFYPRLGVRASNGPEGFAAAVRLEGPGAPADHARHLERKPSRKLAAGVPVERLVAWYYDVDAHAERFRAPFLQAVAARGGAAGAVAAQIERAAGAPVERLISLLGNEALLAVHESPDGNPVPVLTAAFSVGDARLSDRVAAGFPRLAAALALPARRDAPGVWSVGLETLYPNPFIPRLFLTRTTDACLLLNRMPAPVAREIRIADPGPDALPVAAGEVDLARLAEAARRLRATVDLASIDGAARVLAFLDSPAARGSVRFAVVSRPDATELTLEHRKGADR